MEKLIAEIEEFKELENNRLFDNAKVDVGGHGIFWNEKLDISSEKIWNNGIEI